jgi:hypothetical protein
MKLKTNLWLALTMSITLINFSLRSQTYCTPSSSTCECEVTNVSIVGSNSELGNSSGCTPGGYADYTAQSVTFLQGTTYTGTTSSNPQGYFQGQISIWIDWNMDGDFLDANEAIFNSLSSTAGEAPPLPFTVNVPAANPLGSTRMRVRSSGNVTAYTACGSVPIGETEDYTIIIANTPPPPPSGYCAANGGCDGGAAPRYISNVTYGAVNNSTTCGSGSYSDFTTMKSDIAFDGTVNITVEASASNPADAVSVFVDWNNDKDFNDPNEAILLQGNAGLYTGALTPGSGAIIGETRLRVAMYWSGNGTYNGCGARAIGEVEDYTLNITAPAPNCVINPTPANNATNICRSAALAWNRDALGSQPTGYKVYFGLTTNPPLVSDQSTTTYDPGILVANTDYFWKVIAYNLSGDAVGCAEYKFKTTDLKAAITPNPAEVCTGAPLVMNGNPTGGPGINPANAWSGPGAAKLNATNVQSPTFTSTDIGLIKLVYTVTDVNGCKSADSLDVNVKEIVPVLAVISITDGSNPTCVGSNVEFTAALTNGGATPGYSWRVNGVEASTTPVFSTSSLANSDQVDVLIASNAKCVDVASKQSNVITMTVTTEATPTVNISITNDPYCSGDPINFITASSAEGNAPVYDWKVNSISVASGSTYSSGTLVNSDVVSCELTSSSSCATTPTALSNELIIQYTAKVDVEVLAAVTEGSNPACPNEVIEFTAQPSNGGANPTYEWFLNNSSVSTLVSYSSGTFVDGDEIYCVINSDASCVNETTVNSDIVIISIILDAEPTVEVAFEEGGSIICDGEIVIFKPVATYPGADPIYEWFLNSVSVSSTELYTNSTLADLDEIYCELTSSLTCVTNPTATSENVTMTVFQVPEKPTITVDGDILTSSADFNNQWQINGTDIAGAIEKTYQMLQNDNYSVYTSENICASEISEVYFFQTLGINTLNSIKEVSVSPNPSKGIFYLNLNDVNASSFEVFSVLGAKVSSNKVNSQNVMIDLSNFKNGVYLLKVISEEGIFTTRLVKN